MAWDDHSCLSLSEYQALRLNCCWSFPAELIGPSDSSWTLSSAKQFNGRQNSSGCVHLPFSPFCSPEFLIQNIAVLFYLKTRDVKWRPHHHRYWEGGGSKKTNLPIIGFIPIEAESCSWFLMLWEKKHQSCALADAECVHCCAVSLFQPLTVWSLDLSKLPVFPLLICCFFFLSASSAGSLNIVHSNFCAV